MWIEGWERTKLTIHYTFSEMLAENSFVQGVYIAFCAVYTCVIFIILGLVVKFYWKDGVEEITPEGVIRNSKPGYTCLLRLFTAAYITCALTQIGCMWAIAWVDTNNFPIPHGILAGFAFGSAILSTIILFIRRVILSKIVETPHLTFWFFFFNFLWECTLLGLGITLIVVRTGEYEFTVMLMIILTYFFQLYDFMMEPNLEHRYNNSKVHAKIKLDLKPQKSFLEKLFRKKHIY